MGPYISAAEIRKYESKNSLQILDLACIKCLELEKAHPRACHLSFASVDAAEKPLPECRSCMVRNFETFLSWPTLKRRVCLPSASLINCTNYSGEGGSMKEFML